MSILERKWWFIAPIAGITAWTTTELMALAGMAMGTLSMSQWLVFFVFFLCFFGIHRGLSFAAWLLCLMVAPDLAKKGV